MLRQKILECQCNNAAIMVESCLVLRRPGILKGQLFGMKTQRQPKGAPGLVVENEQSHPDIEFDVFISDRLNVESDSRDSGDRLIQLELVEDCCEAGNQSRFVLIQLLSPVQSYL